MALDNNTERILAGALGGALSQGTPQASLSQTLGELVPYLRSAEAAASGNGGDNEADSSLGQLARQISELALIARLQTDSVDTNTQALVENSLTKSGGEKGSAAGSVGRTILSFLGGGFGLGQLVGALFGGGDTDKAVPSLPTYTLPTSVELSGAVTKSGIQELNYGPEGLPRATEVPKTTTTNVPVTIQVQAIDSRSFRDHSSEIASAVRDALLHSHALTDVVLEL